MVDEETRLGIPLIPGRELSRSHLARWWGGLADAPFAHRWLPTAAAASLIAALIVAVVMGTAPFAAAVGVAVMVPAAVIDIEQRRLPNTWVGGALIALVVSLAVGAAVGDPTTTSDTIRALVAGGLAMSLPVLALHVVSPGAMGFGDVKAAMVLGAAVGTIDWRLGAVALCLAACGAAIVGVIGRHRTIPFGPFLVVGAWVSVLAGGRIISLLFTGGSTP